jgi:hypothetical protein
MAVEPDQVAAFLGQPDDAAIMDTAEQAIPIVTVMVKAYVRGTGDWEPNDELEAVIVTAAARMVSNPGQLPYDTTAGVFTHSVRGAFQGWTLAELFVLKQVPPPRSLAADSGQDHVDFDRLQLVDFALRHVIEKLNNDVMTNQHLIRAETVIVRAA